MDHQKVLMYASKNMTRQMYQFFRTDSELMKEHLKSVNDYIEFANGYLTKDKELPREPAVEKGKQNLLLYFFKINILFL